MNTFYKIPKFLLDDEKYKNVKFGAKVLYAVALSQNSLSKRNEWKDQNGNTFFYLSLEKSAKLINSTERSISRYLNELSSANLITRKKQGKGKPNLIYINNIKS